MRDGDVIGAVSLFHKSASGILRLFSVTTITRSISRYDGQELIGRDEYDVEWCRYLGCYIFHNSGGGGGLTVEVDGPYFVQGEAQVKEKPCQLVDYRDKPPWRSKRTKAIRERNRTRKLRKLPKFFADQVPHQYKNILDFLEVQGIEETAVYCSTCRDWYPGNELCKHCWWCDKTGWYSTPDERCKCKDREECDHD